MKSNKKFIIILSVSFFVLLSLTLYTSFSINSEVETIVIKNITPVYDENGTMEVSNAGVIFNDKNQEVQYKVVIENTQNNDVKISDINLSIPTEEFLQYEIEGIEAEEVLAANSTKELTVSFETMGIKGWGRNFSDKLKANIVFDKVSKNEEVPSAPEVDNKEDDSTEDEPNTDNNEDTTEDNSSNKEDLNDENEVTKPNTDINNQNDSTEDNVVENPYTNTGRIILYIAVTGISVVVIVVLKDKKVNKYLILVFVLTTTLSFVKAEEPIELSVSFDVRFESQNVMKPSGLEYDAETSTITSHGTDFWVYAPQIKEFHIYNEITEIAEYDYEFDVTEAQNGRVMAYLVENKDDSSYYDLYLQSDGIIYPNENASYYFAGMTWLEVIENLSGFDTSKVSDMSYMFADNSDIKSLDVSSFDTSNVTDMSYMFCGTGLGTTTFTLDVSNFDTSKVTNMSHMFQNTGYYSEIFTLDLSNFDTSNVTDMSYMFTLAGGYSSIFTLNISNFDTSKVTNMERMFELIGYYNENFTLDVSNFDTSKVTNMSYMFNSTGYCTTIFTLDLSNFNTSKVTDMSGMFYSTGGESSTLELDVSNFDTSNVTNMMEMFFATGMNSETFSLELGDNFDTSKVTNMSGMFCQTGLNSTNFTLDLGGKFDTSNVTDMSHMFNSTGITSTEFILDLGDKFDTSNVTDMSHMFYSTGMSNTDFILDLGDEFDTSIVTAMRYMFNSTGWSSTKMNISITIKNPNITNYDKIFYNVATIEDSQIKVNYTAETEELVEQMIATKSANSNVVKGNLIVD